MTTYYSDRDEIEERYDELKQQYDEIIEKSEAYNEHATNGTATKEELAELYAEITSLNEDTDKEEMDELREVLDELPKYVDLILADYFEAYVRDYAESVASRDVDFDAWPYNCIDWGDAEAELRQDYSEITIDGVDYLWREA